MAGQRNSMALRKPASAVFKMTEQGTKHQDQAMSAYIISLVMARSIE